MVTAYKAGSPNQLQLLLRQQDPQQLSRMAVYQSHLVSARQDAIAQYQSTLDELAQIEPELVRQTQKLAESQARLSQRHARLKATRAERDRTLKKLNAAIDAKDEKLRKNQADRANLEKLLAEVVRQLSDTALGLAGDSFKSRKGKMGWPTKGQMGARFGANRAGELRWQGVKILAPEGREVKAIHAGRVVFADYLRGQGMLMVIDHGDNYLSLYAHNQVLYQDTGDWVTAGELIGRAGTSGGQAEAGIYFEIRHAGKPVDPAHWCRG